MMSNLPSSGFEVTHPSNNQLMVICHYAWWYVIVAVLLLGLPAVRSLIKGIKTHQAQPLWWSLILGICCASAISLFPTGTAIFDRSKGTVVFQRRGFLFIRRTYEYPLSQVRYATLETATADSRFVIVFKGGAREGLSAFTSQGGQSEAVDAVNDFLGVNPVP